MHRRVAPVTHSLFVERISLVGLMRRSLLLQFWPCELVRRPGVGNSQVVTRTEVLRGPDIAQSINRAAARLGVDAIVISSVISRSNRHQKNGARLCCGRKLSAEAASRSS